MFLLMLALIVFGFIMSLKGCMLISRFIGLIGALILTVVFMAAGVVGSSYYLSGWPVAAVGAICGISGAMIGWRYATRILWASLAMAVFALGWVAGWRLGVEVGGEEWEIILAALVSGFIASLLFSLFARRLMVGAISMMGGGMAAVGSFYIFLERVSVSEAGLASAAIFLMLSVMGYFIQEERNRTRGRRCGGGRAGNR
jgi:hypothetical protein